jgi:hypothetical protein
MTPLLPRRFSIRAMLAVMAIVALAIWAIRDYASLRSARNRFQYVSALYQVARVLADEVVVESRNLMEAESASIWISRRRAIAAHVDRLNYLLKKVQSPVSESSREYIEHRVAIIRKELAQYDPIDTATPESD